MEPEQLRLYINGCTELTSERRQYPLLLRGQLESVILLAHRRFGLICHKLFALRKTKVLVCSSLR